ncbi:MAG: sigma-70 family RNA polymerase sigma factor [Chloroflexota bacterium]
MSNALSISELAEMCRIETDKSRENQPHSPRYCLELLRLGMVDGCQSAWYAIENQYKKLIQSRITTKVGQEDLIQDVWIQLIKRFKDGIPDFPTLPSLHAYIARTATNLVIDAVRKNEREERRVAQLEQEIQSRGEVDEESQLDMEELKKYIREKLVVPPEKLLFQLLFEVGLTPKEIVEEHPNDFPSVQEVNKIRERIIKRLRRDPKIHRYLEDD